MEVALQALAIQNIHQTGPQTFEIVWNDGKVQSYFLPDLQASCGCASCSEEKKEPIEDVRAVKIVSVGRYGLKVFFTKGCSNGIYGYDFLYHFGSDS